MSFGKWLHKHVKQVEGFGRKAMDTLQKNDPLKQMGGMMGGMMGGQNNSGSGGGSSAPDPNAQARSDAAAAMKRQAGGAQISFTGNNETPSSQA